MILGDEDIVKLCVLRVNATDDDKYRAANTSTAPHHNPPVNDTPMNIEMLTTSFLRRSGIQVITTPGTSGGGRDNTEKKPC